MEQQSDLATATANASATSARRLMFVIEALTVGGAEQLVVDLASEFVSRGDHITVVCLSNRGELADRFNSSVGVHVLNKKRGIDFRIIPQLRALVKKQRIEVVNSHLWTANLWTRLALCNVGVPIVITEHNRDVWKRTHNKIIDRILSRFTRKLIAVSRDTASFYKEDVGIDDSLVCVVNNGIDTERYAAGNGQTLRKQLAADNQLLIGTVGRLAPQKNHARLVHTAVILKERKLAFKVIIAGDGPEFERTQALIDQNDLSDHVTLLGKRTDIPDLLAAMDVFVLSSDREGHPLSALEAQAAGTPVVLTNAGGSADAIAVSGDNNGGMLVEKTPEAIADAIIALAENRPLLAQMSQFASTFALANFDKQTMINRYSDIFDSVSTSSTSE